MADSEDEVKRVEVPLLKAYLRGERGDPPHIPAWINPTGWAVFLVSAYLLAAVADAGCIGIGVAAASAMALVHFLRQGYRPRNDEERVHEIHYASIKKLKGMVDDGLDRRLPPPVLRALEEAVATHNTAVARLSVEPGIQATERIEAVRRALHACFVVSTSVMRGDECSKREWKAILANHRLIAEVVDAIDTHVSRMREVHSLDTERLAALRELERVDDPGTLKVND